VYDRYKFYNGKIEEKLGANLRPFASSIFSAATFNFGPNVWTFSHRDVLNVPESFCAVHSLGYFDPRFGGHMVLHDLKIFIEFPPGSLILIPSATLSHSNIRVCKGEERASFTQYTAGGLFRWVDNGFRTEEELEREDPEGFREMLRRKATRAGEGIALWSTLDELAAKIL
jgi:hypothetical protein